MVPVIDAFKTAHNLSDITVVADAGMISEANQVALLTAKLTYILGARIPFLPDVVREGRDKHPDDAIPDGADAHPAVAINVMRCALIWPNSGRRHPKAGFTRGATAILFTCEVPLTLVQIGP
jgi:hypothetical protein